MAAGVAPRYRGAMNEQAADWAEEAEARMLEAAIPLAARSGWTSTTLTEAAKAAGLSSADAELLMPNGPRDLAALFSRRHDRAAMAILAEVDPRSLKVRERIARAVAARLDAAAADEAATRRCAGFLALPTHLALAARLQWESADWIWRWAGDTATDENHYSKRAILSAILGSALMMRLSAGRAEAEVYVHRRIGEVMDFEKWKAGLPKVDLAAQAAGALGKMRYGG
jgi:ubiquinone biosynthesis protein COQ9